MANYLVYDGVVWISAVIDLLAWFAVETVTQFLDRLHVAFLGFGDQFLGNAAQSLVILASLFQLHSKRISKRLFLPSPAVFVPCHLRINNQLKLQLTHVALCSA